MRKDDDRDCFLVSFKLFGFDASPFAASEFTHTIAGHRLGDVEAIVIKKHER